MREEVVLVGDLEADAQLIGAPPKDERLLLVRPVHLGALLQIPLEVKLRLTIVVDERVVGKCLPATVNHSIVLALRHH